MTNKQNEILKWINIAIDSFNLYENYLISRDLSERCICSKFASYLEKSLFLSPFHEYIIDVEYNRGMHADEYAIKSLNGHKAVVDLIVHKRGYNHESCGFDNLVCIEMKKNN